MVAFGGAGPLVAGRMVKQLELRRAFIPWVPGLFSAYGLMVANIGRDFVSTRILRIEKFPFDEINSVFETLEQKAMKEMSEEKVPEKRIVLTRSLDMRFVGQSFELNIPCPSSNFVKESINDIRDKFVSEHRKIYGHAAEREPIEIVNLRVSATGIVTPPTIAKIPRRTKGTVRDVIKTHRQIFFREIGEQIRCPVYDRTTLLSGDQIEGPAVIEQLDSTTVVYQKQLLNVDDYGLLVLQEVR
jgi:N-methylhydantoinase A